MNRMIAVSVHVLTVSAIICASLKAPKADNLNELHKFGRKVKICLLRQRSSIGIVAWSQCDEINYICEFKWGNSIFWSQCLILLFLSNVNKGFVKMAVLVMLIHICLLAGVHTRLRFDRYKNATVQKGLHADLGILSIISGGSTAWSKIS